MLVAGLLTTLQNFSLQNQNLMCLNLLQKGGKKQTKTKHIFQSPEGGLYQEVVVMSRESLFWMRYLTELFTMNKHALYCKDILYPVTL